MKHTSKSLAAATALLGLSLAMTGCGRTTVNLNDYLTLAYDGYNNVGLASYSFDLEQMIADNPKAFGLEESYSDMELFGVELVLDGSFSGSLDKTNGLSNGDTVTFTWDSINTDSIEERYPVRLSFSDETVEVSGLEEAEIFDPFAGLVISYEGIAPNGKAIIHTPSEVSGLSYTADTTSGLNNGDTITVTVSAPSGGDLQSYLITQGKYANATERQYTVEGLASYLQKLDDLPEEACSAMDSHAQDTLNAHIAQKWGEDEQLQSIALIGNYLLTPKDASISVSSHNLLYFIYKVNVLTAGTNVEYYYYSYYPDVMLLEDGACSYNLNSISVPSGGSSFGSAYGTAFNVSVEVDGKNKSYYYIGYQDLNSLFNEQVTARIDKYNYETTIQ